MAALTPPPVRFTIKITPADGAPPYEIGSFESIDHAQPVGAEIKAWLLGQRPRPKLNDRVDAYRPDGRPFVEAGESVSDYIRDALRGEYEMWTPAP